MLNLSRRSFLSVGGLGLLSMPQVLRAQKINGTSHKAVINIFLGGGPPHQDMWDIKTEAPSEIRGPFKPIPTNVGGVHIGECFPKIASMFDKFTAIRSVVGSDGSHDGYQCVTGWSRKDMVSGTSYPAIGACASKILGPVDPAVPVAVGLADPTQHAPWSEAGGAGYLGDTHKPFKPNGEMMEDLKLNMQIERFKNRKELLTGFAKLNATIDKSVNVDTFTEEAFGVLTSSALVDALDISKEDPKIREMYGDGKPFKFQYDGAPTVNEHVLMARRLVEAGARSVTLSYGRWDSHGDNFGLVRDHGGKLDQCVSALVSDLDQRGMLDDTLVVVWGEFGRTPKINPKGGRDHWPQVSAALLAGGGFNHGQIIGSTNRLGEVPETRPVHIQEICATLYRGLGIDTMSTTLLDNTGRPQYLLDHREPLKELI
tara:strand:+ start:331 stop:1614 length:1284 start_codon:yes stop_codon:yes gene_type:complete